MRERGPRKHCQAGEEKEKARPMQRQTALSLGEELADRTQERIVRRAAWDWCRLCNGRSTARVCEERSGDTRDGSGSLVGDLPAVCHKQGELRHDDEQAQQCLEAAC